MSDDAPRLPFAPVWREWLVLFALLGVFTVAGVHERWFWRLDTTIYDAALSLWSRAAPPDIILVGIDEPSLERLGRWPWPRARLAAAIRAIATDGPRAILVDVILAEPQAGDDGRADEELAAAVRAAGNVVLPVFFAGMATEVVPLPALQAAARLGHAQLELDPDGIARTVYLYEGLNRPHRPHVALAMLEAAGVPPPAAAPATAAASDGVWRRADWRFIPYAGPPGHFRQVSIAAILEGSVPPGTFGRAYVLLGATATGLGDANPVPTSGLSRPMPGIEVNANVLAGLRAGELIQPLATGWVAAASLLVLGALLGAYLVLSSRSALLATALALGGALVGVLAALRAGSVWMPPAALLLAILLAYPLWSWRRLEAAQRFLDLQLAELGGDATPKGDGGSSGDPLQRRIERVHAAQLRLARTARERDELLKFLSRDMRAPQALIIEEIELRRAHARPGLTPMDDAHFEAIEALARKSLLLAEEFVQLTRTGWHDAADLAPVDLAVVADNAADDAWPMARYKSVFIERAFPSEAPARGDFHMLFGALRSLLHNAIKSTPPGGVVTIAVERRADAWWCTVADQGPGIPEAVQRALLDAGAPTAAFPEAGAFLGLELVKAVAQRHHGDLTIESGPGQGATFRLRLPAGGDAAANAGAVARAG